MRCFLPDLYKALAAQLILLHHFTWYGPLADKAAESSPRLAELIAWLAQHGRYAVAVFLVVGGFLAARSVPPGSVVSLPRMMTLIAARYFRLVLPFAVALSLTLLCFAVLRAEWPHEALGDPPRWSQILLHILLLHEILDVESLTVGAWYVAIDFQLFALFVLLVWLTRRTRRVAALFLPIILMAALSLFFFNRNPRWDSTPFYFFGAYGLGLISGWVSAPNGQRRWFWGLVALSLLAWILDPRPRLAIALFVAITLVYALHPMPASAITRIVEYLGRTAYALFLVHFPVLMVTSAFIERMFPPTPIHALIGLLLAWGASMVAADLFHRRLEKPWRDFRLPRLDSAGQVGRRIEVGEG
ncbi:MAG: acyltransferase [Rhodocyclaceae bacterium]|nr:acyltransferase [Rhodocyclaceae bacterium]